MKEENELTYGETIKQPFPKLEDVESLNVEAPEWYKDAVLLVAFRGTCNKVPIHLDNVHRRDYNAVKALYENSKDFKVTWKLKQTDQHAEIKAEYEKALKKYDVVYFEWSHKSEGSWHSSKHYPEVTIYKGITDCEIQLKYYNIDWNKLLSWSYDNGEFVECEFCDHDFKWKRGTLISNYDGRPASRLKSYIHCRITKGTTIKDEWLKEAK